MKFWLTRRQICRIIDMIDTKFYGKFTKFLCNFVIQNKLESYYDII